MNIHSLPYLPSKLTWKKKTEKKIAESVTGIKIKSEVNCIISMQIRKTLTFFYIYLKVNLLFYLIYQFRVPGFGPFPRIVRRENEWLSERFVVFKQNYFVGMEIYFINQKQKKSGNLLMSFRRSFQKLIFATFFFWLQLTFLFEWWKIYFFFFKLFSIFFLVVIGLVNGVRLPDLKIHFETSGKEKLLVRLTSKFA